MIYVYIWSIWQDRIFMLVRQFFSSEIHFLNIYVNLTSQKLTIMEVDSTNVESNSINVNHQVYESIRKTSWLTLLVILTRIISIVLSYIARKCGYSPHWTKRVHHSFTLPYFGPHLHLIYAIQLSHNNLPIFHTIMSIYYHIDKYTSKFFLDSFGSYTHE